jgi:hypothetical protein
MTTVPPCHSLFTADLKNFYVGTDKRWEPRSPWVGLQKAGITHCTEIPDYNKAGELACIVSANGAQEICFIHVRLWWRALPPPEASRSVRASEEETIAAQDAKGLTSDTKSYSFNRLSAWATGHFTNEPLNESSSSLQQPIFMSNIAKKGAFDTMVVNTFLTGRSKLDKSSLAGMLSTRGFTGKLLLVPKYGYGKRTKLPFTQKKIPVSNTSVSHTATDCHLFYAGDLSASLRPITKARANDAKANISPESKIDGSMCRETKGKACGKESHFCAPGPLDAVGDFILAAAVGTTEGCKRTQCKTKK